MCERRVPTNSLMFPRIILCISKQKTHARIDTTGTRVYDLEIEGDEPPRQHTDPTHPIRRIACINAPTSIGTSSSPSPGGTTGGSASAPCCLQPCQTTDNITKKKETTHRASHHATYRTSSAPTDTATSFTNTPGGNISMTVVRVDGGTYTLSAI